MGIMGNKLILKAMFLEHILYKIVIVKFIELVFDFIYKEVFAG